MAAAYIARQLPTKPEYSNNHKVEDALATWFSRHHDQLGYQETYIVKVKLLKVNMQDNWA
jgi:hypothetical protein